MENLNKDLNLFKEKADILNKESQEKDNQIISLKEEINTLKSIIDEQNITIKSLRDGE